MGLALRCEDCQCLDNIQIGTSPFVNVNLRLCDSCQFDKFSSIYNVSQYDPKKIVSFEGFSNEN